MAINSSATRKPNKPQPGKVSTQASVISFTMRQLTAESRLDAPTPMMAVVLVCVVLTGTLSQFKRSEAQKLIEEAGGACQSAVTQKTTLVIAGESAGSKLEKAQALGVKVIDEAEFIKILSENGIALK